MTNADANSQKRQGERNPGASIQQRLRNRAKATGENAALLLIRYLNERFLYRLSVSPFRDRFILRGATLFSIWAAEPHRATRDIDLLASGDNSAEAMAHIIRSVCAQPVEADGVTFLPDTLTMEERASERVYPGLHIEVLAALGTARPRLEIDMAFGEVTSPPPRTETLPALLGMPAPEVRAYQKETVIAEKCQALVHWNLVNTRMKDFYDLWYLSRTFSFDGGALCEALQATFARREEAFPADGRPAALTVAFAQDPLKVRQWTAFVGKGALSAGAVTLPALIADLHAFLQPPLAALAASEVLPLFWSPDQGWQNRPEQDGANQ